MIPKLLDIPKVPVSIILVNWMNYKDTIVAVESILQGSRLPEEIIIVDNDSQNGSFEILSSYFESIDFLKITCISSSKNLGFGSANNLALRYITSCDDGFIWLLNPDTIVDKEALYSLIKVMEEDNSCGAVGSTILNYESHELQTLGGGQFNFITGITSNITQKDHLNKLDFITAASILIREKIFREIKFDKDFFLYWEDVDLSFNIKKIGWSLCYCDKSIIYHKESTSLGKRTPSMDFYFTQSSLIFYKKHVRYYFIPMILSTFRRLVHRLFSGKFANIKSIFRAVF